MRSPTLTPHVESHVESHVEPVLRCGFDGKPYAIFVVTVVLPHDGNPGAEYYYWLNPDNPDRAMNYTAQFVDRLDPDVMRVYVAAECVRLAADGPDKWPPVEAVMPWPLYTPGTLLREVSNASTGGS